MKLKIGIVLQGKSFTPSFKEIKNIALRAEELGFDSIWASDGLPIICARAFRWKILSY
jgi:alkanesulfonate monooxygenase SsuD/methylene tetrahydromethanopterin reductase-like flavin-dependent oxidoreductase (luciferase family)